MTIAHVLILSVIEGLTEFLPVSSTGHLILASEILGVTPTAFTKSFDIAIQLGAILAVIVLYARTIQQRFSLVKPIGIAFVPTAIVGLTLYKVIKDYFLENTTITIIALFVGGILLLVIDPLIKKVGKKTENQGEPSVKQALLIGVVQSFSIVPGVSRAAATIIGGIMVGLTREEAVEFSFFLAVPTIAAATALDLAKTHASFTSNELLLMVIGFIAAFVSALLGIKFFISLIKNRSFALFGAYRIVLAIVYALFIGR